MKDVVYFILLLIICCVGAYVGIKIVGDKMWAFNVGVLTSCVALLLYYSFYERNKDA